MLTDLKYAMNQLKRLCTAKQTIEGMMMRDGIERAMDALERCIEAAEMAEGEECECGGHKASCTCENAMLERAEMEAAAIPQLPFAIRG